MEAVLRVRFSGIVMPWKEVIRGCLVILLLGILCLCVQNYARRNEAAESLPAGSQVKQRTVAGGLEADFTESFKPTAMDIRKRLKALDTDLSAAVKPVPIQNSLAKSYTLPEIDLGLPDEAFINEAIIEERTESVVIEELPATYVPEVPKENIVPENPTVPDITDIPEENVVPENPTVPEEPAALEEIAGFILDEEGYITGYTERVVIRDDLLIIPESESLVGIRSGAFHGLSENIIEVYLPAKLCDIEPGAFDVFPNLMFVEVSGDNPYYYSLNGLLYHVSGEEVFCPMGRTTE